MNKLFLLIFVFVISSAAVLSAPPVIDDFYCLPLTANLGELVSCYIHATDDSYDIYFDRYCRWDPAISPSAYYPSGPNAEYASNGWLGPYDRHDAGLTFSCPRPSQWPVVGTYTIKACATDPPEHGYNYYSDCLTETITIGSTYNFAFSPVDPTDDQTLAYSTTNPRNKVLYFMITYSGGVPVSGVAHYFVNDYNTGASVSTGQLSFSGLTGSNTFNTANVQIEDGYNYTWQIVVDDNTHGTVSSSNVWRFQVNPEPTVGYPDIKSPRLVKTPGPWTFPSGAVLEDQDLLTGNTQAVADFRTYVPDSRICFWWWKNWNSTILNSCFKVGGPDSDIPLSSSYQTIYQQLNPIVMPWCPSSPTDGFAHCTGLYGQPFYWSVSLDDTVHGTIATDLMNFTVAPAGNQAPTLSLISPTADYQFPTYTKSVNLTARGSDTDDAWLNLVFKFDESNVPINSMKQICTYYSAANSTKICPVPSEYLIDGRSYRWCAGVNDFTVSSRVVEQCRYFTIKSDISNPLPVLDSVTCFRDKVGINQTDTCTATGHDTSAPIYFDLYCDWTTQSKDAQYVNDSSYDGNPSYASIGWKQVNLASGSQTFTCPNPDYVKYGQWQTPGTKKVLACITDGAGGIGFSYPQGYSVCKSVNVIVQDTMVFGDTNTTLEIPYETTILLEQFYNGITKYFGKFLEAFLIIMFALMFCLLGFRLYDWARRPQ